MVAEVGGGTWYSDIPRDIPSPNTPYSACYGRLAAHYGGPLCSPIPCWCDKKHLQVHELPIYGETVVLTVLSVLIVGSLHTNPPPYEFLNLYGACLQAPRTPKFRY
jgi:hypothetical protein